MIISTGRQKPLRIIRIGICLTAVPLLSACGAERLPPPEPASAAFVTTSPDYRLDAGDFLKVTVYGETELSGEQRIGPDGHITIPLAGPIDARGLTPLELAERIRARLANRIVVDPRVSVTITEMRPFYIYGEVSKPGSYPYEPGLTVEMAIAKAGGYRDRANRNRVVLRRKGENERQFMIESSTPILMQPGDVVRVPERYL